MAERTPPDDDYRNRRVGQLRHLAAEAGLGEVGVKPPLRVYIQQMWQRRAFAVTVPLGELRAHNMHTVLGNVWHVLNPLLLLGVYFVVFGVILDFTRGGLSNFLGFLAVGIFLYQYAQKCIIQGAGSVVGNLGLIRSLRFPRAILPISSIIGETIAFVPALGVMFVFVLGTGERPSIKWLMALPVVGALGLVNLGGAFFVARLATVFRDVQNLLPFIFRLLFYASGVLFPVSRFVSEDSALWPVFIANPLYAAITLARAVLLEEVEAGGVEVASLGAWAGGALVLGFAFFLAGEKDYGRG